MKMIEATLPYPPSVNHYWLNKVRWVIVEEDKKKKKKAIVQTFIAKRGRKYREAVGWMLLRHRHLKFMNDNLYLEINYYPPDRRRRDTDNIQKAILDSLQHAGIYEDDYQVAELYTKRKEVKKGGEIKIKLYELTN